MYDQVVYRLFILQVIFCCNQHDYSFQRYYRNKQPAAYWCEHSIMVYIVVMVIYVTSTETKDYNMMQVSQ